MWQGFFKKTHIKQWVSGFFANCKKNHACAQAYRGEDGFLMLAMVALVLLLGAAYTSYAFVQKKQFDWNINYALGQQYAQVARAAHLYVQAVAYDPAPSFTPTNADHTSANFLQSAGTTSNNITIADLKAANFLPQSFLLNERKYGNIDIIAYADMAPRGSINAAATAFVAMNIDLRTDAGGNEIQRRTPSEIAAFRAGAASKGMSRLGIAPNDSGITGLEIDLEPCGGVVSFVRWGDNSNDCLTLAQANTITSNFTGFATPLDENDAIAPAWEVVTENEQIDAVYRYPQPGRPDAQTINADLQFDGNGILGVSYIDTEYLGCDPASALPCVPVAQMQVNAPSVDNTNPIGILSVTQSSGANVVLTGAVDISESLSSGRVVANNGLDAGQNINVTGGLNEAAGHDATLGVDQIIMVGDATNIGLREQDETNGLAINVAAGNDFVVLGDMSHTIPDPFSTVPAGNFSMTGDFQASSSIVCMGQVTQDPITGDDICIIDSSSNIALSGDSATGSITADRVDVTGDGRFGSLSVDPASEVTVDETMTINVDCFGAACPDAITEAPDDPL